MVASVDSIYGSETWPPLIFNITVESAYMQEIRRDETNWLDILPSTAVVPPFIPPPLTISGGVPSILVE